MPAVFRIGCTLDNLLYPCDTVYCEGTYSPCYWFSCLLVPGHICTVVRADAFQTVLLCPFLHGFHGRLRWFWSSLSCMRLAVGESARSCTNATIWRKRSVTSSRLCVPSRYYFGATSLLAAPVCEFVRGTPFLPAGRVHRTYSSKIDASLARLEASSCLSSQSRMPAHAHRVCFPGWESRIIHAFHYISVLALRWSLRISNHRSKRTP
jgi:hypothetical protein